MEVAIVAERVQYYDKDGRLITESLKDYTKKNILKQFRSLDQFLTVWNAADRKAAILLELEEQGIFIEALVDEVNRDLDPFDMICHVAFGQPPLTRKERAENVKKRNYFAKYGDKARVVLEALLQKYADEGIQHIETMNVLKVNPLNEMGTPMEIIERFGGKEKYLKALKELEEDLYLAA